MLIAIPKVTFAYIGVELLTTTAYEARNSSQLKLTAMTIAPQICLLYVAIVVTFVVNVAWNDPSLPKVFGQAPAAKETDITARDAPHHNTSALPIVALVETGSDTLASVLSGILMYSGLSAANTGLYVASRTVYGLSRNIDVNRDANIFRRFMHRLSDVLPWTGAPLWGVIIPVVVLYWLPFIHIEEDTTKELVRT
ncbi:hypothetical protein LTR84_001260 [Exophiala bonariae]|uniref:Amino acid permease/ SLC12A domain-containing protein n=1 Tax=Exophiala bonariae TaxID=1690606 RepID=A0AAV9NWB5_9EURO|nr:hypothetical protein LTR84_001260 [Exophiala bonariae]